MRLFILGWPLETTLSPAIHNAAFRSVGLDWDYRARPTPPDKLAHEVARLRDADCRGASVTIPHKEAALKIVDVVDESARDVGAVNCIVNEGGRLIGYNTDAEGFLRGLAEAEFNPAGRFVVVLGAGGAARAVSHALVRREAHVTIINRTAPRAEALASLFGLSTGTNIDSALRGAHLLVNATSVGWKDDGFVSLPIELMDAGALVVDLIYRDTPLLKAARARGLRTQDGLPMLVNQAALSFQLWTGRDAPVAAMKAAVLR